MLYPIDVKLLRFTPDALNLIIHAARTCYQSFEKSDAGGPNDIKMIRRAIEDGHHSVLEHATFSFEIYGSRWMQQQLTRHRIMSPSIESMRYVDGVNANNQMARRFVEPLSIRENELLHDGKRAADIYWRTLIRSVEAYRELVDVYKVPKEDARYVIPGSYCSSGVYTANLREWRHVVYERTCRVAQWELRHIAKRIKMIIEGVAPVFMYRAGKHVNCPSFEMCGNCLSYREVEEYDGKETQRDVSDETTHPR